MILVLLRSIKLEFTRPLREIDSLCDDGLLDDHILVQAGFTTFSSRHLELVPFFEHEKLNSLIDQCDLVITHAGTGSVLSALKKRKRTIAVARYQELQEHVDNHQLDLLDEFSRKNYLIPWYKDDKLLTLLDRAKSFTPSPYVSQKEAVIKYISESIKAS